MENSIMEELRPNHSIHFYDWDGQQHLGTVKDVLALSDDFGNFFLVTVETGTGDAQFEMEDYNGVLIGQPWNT